MCHVSRHMSRVTCHMSRVTCHMSHITIFFFFFGQRGEAYWWRVCYQRGLPRLVFKAFMNISSKQLHSQTIRAEILREGSPFPNLSHVMFCMSHVTCYMSHVTCHLPVLLSVVQVAPEGVASWSQGCCGLADNTTVRHIWSRPKHNYKNTVVFAVWKVVFTRCPSP